MITLKRERVVDNNNHITYVTYNDYLTLVVKGDGRCCFEFHNDERLDWSILYASESDADDAYCARDIKWEPTVLAPSTPNRLHRNSRLLFA